MNTKLFEQVLMQAGFVARKSLDEGSSRSDALNKAGQVLRRRFGAQPWAAVLPSLALAWAENAFSIVEPTHKLAASLMATSVSPEVADSIALPWRCFGVEVPAGLLSVDGHFVLLLNSHGGELWSLRVGGGLVAVGHERSLGDYAQFDVIETVAPENPASWVPTEEQADQGVRIDRLAFRLMVGCCIEMNATRSPPAGSSGNQIRLKRGEPHPYRYRLSRPVSLDVRDVVREFAEHGRGVPRSVQVLVRGHYKSQPHGPGHSLRKWIHVEPYWRGPEDAPIAVRKHIAGDEDD